MSNQYHSARSFSALCISGALTISGWSLSNSVAADNAGAFLGGMITSNVVHNMRARTEAEQVQAAAAVQSASKPAQSSSGGASSVESRIDTLDQLLAKGYITKDEYDKRKKAILDDI